MAADDDAARRAQQRADWKKAVARKNAAQRNQRGKRKTADTKAGMHRKASGK